MNRIETRLERLEKIIDQRTRAGGLTVNFIQGFTLEEAEAIRTEGRGPITGLTILFCGPNDRPARPVEELRRIIEQAEG